MTGFHLDLLNEHTMKSGTYRGHFVDERFIDDLHPEGHSWPMDVYLVFSHRGQRFSAVGVDEIGDFQLKGTISGETLFMKKSYTTHQLHYRGQVVRESMVGQWFFPGHQEPGGRFFMELTVPA